LKQKGINRKIEREIREKWKGIDREIKEIDIEKRERNSWRNGEREKYFQCLVIAAT
jgi:hypothetical protein